jgi:thymidylate synthase ThyX
MTQDIFVIDDQHPEDLAMLQALYSRSPASVVQHLDKLKQSGSGKFMDSYYVGYGHASIGDCGATTVFIEQVSMLVAKAVQDNPLYNGQEASTRYLDFSKQRILDPYDAAASAAIQTRWMEMYNRILPLLTEGLKKRYGFDPAQYKSEKTWMNALNARAFDIARALLPVGTTTLLSWSTTLRAARDNLRRLKYHPLPEVRDVAQTIFKKLLEKYPHSFKGDEMAESSGPRDTYNALNAGRTHYVSAADIRRQFQPTADEMKRIAAGEIVARRTTIDLDGLRLNEMPVLVQRPQGSPLPWRLEAYGQYNLLFLLDFGSYRDLQRHRNGVCQIPLIDGQFGMNPWYMQQCAEFLSTEENARLLAEIDAQFAAIADLKKSGIVTTPELNQYLFPMGTQVLVHAAYSVPETTYIGELRSGKTVHSSLRPVAQKFLDLLKQDLPGIALYGDFDEDSWSAKRGEQTIASKVA